MPGIFGFTQNKEEQLNILTELNALQIHVDNTYHKQKNYVNEKIAVSIVSFDFMKDYNFYSKIGDLEIWIYGDPIINGYTGSKAMEQVVQNVSGSFPDFSIIASIDGLFTIIILNAKTNKLYIIGDRSGLCHLYYGVFKGQLVWGSELRTFLSKRIEKTIRQESFHTFLELGYLINNNTWFKEIKLLPPASYLEWDFEKSDFSIKQYWSHEQLQKNSITKKDKAIVTDIAELFAQAVKKRVGENERVGITLSGGQDSRAIFSNIPFRKNGFFAITRGRKGSGDIILAAKVAALRKDCTHILHEINEVNWSNGRIEAVIATSGQKDFFNMNAMASLPIHKKYFDINLDGSEGALLKRSYLNFNTKHDIHILKNKILTNVLGDYDNTMSELLTYYDQINSDRYFFIYENIRRFSVFGSILGHDYGIVSRFPILDHQLQEYLYQLPEKTDIGTLWNKTLIKHFPEYFIHIDNLDSGRRLYANKRINFLSMALHIALSRMGYEKYKRKYHNYPFWIKNYDSGLLGKYIFPENLQLYQYIDPKPVKKVIDTFLNTGEQPALISRLLSLNIFLEYFNKLNESK
ncbi:MAG TPA: asparagine synthase-related protein [Niabella sp.]|nr:asparagine synthase-related protein [Agriterribacter sp.]HUN01332.1 asparagine synthase-related protein [Niabella sp.]